jgi:hypothetical protein
MGLDPKQIGKMLFIGADGQQRFIDPVEFSGENTDFSKYGVGGIKPTDDNILNLARANGALPGSIEKTRGTLTDAGRNATILTDTVNVLNQLSDPAFALDFTGKGAIQANRIVQFADNAANIMTEADGGVGAASRLGKYEWNGKEVSGPAAQRTAFVNKAKDEGYLVNTLNSIAKDSGLKEGSSLVDFLPKNIVENLSAAGASIEKIGLVAEQYFANVMELAYLDARLQEPSNRGLSDQDIKNALARIGAATANPASFAERQLQLLSRLDQAVASLGNTVQVPYGARTNREDVVNFIYRPEVVRGVRESIATATEALGTLQSPHSAQPQRPVQPSSAVTAILQNPNPTQAEVDALSPEEYNQLRQATQQQTPQ